MRVNGILRTQFIVIESPWAPLEQTFFLELCGLVDGVSLFADFSPLVYKYLRDLLQYSGIATIPSFFLKLLCSKGCDSVDRGMI